MEDTEWVSAARLIAINEAAANAAAVDLDARFPFEAIDACRRSGLLSAAFPEELGGPGLDLFELSKICAIVGASCSSSGMILAMHYAQSLALSCYAQENTFFMSTARYIAGKQLLIASATSEVNSPDIRTSLCAFEQRGDRVRLSKNCATVSYFEQASHLLVSARRNAETDADQGLALIAKDDLISWNAGTWDPLGMRGTCSPRIQLEADFSTRQVLATPFRTVLNDHLAPISHLLWASVWLGIAKAATRLASLHLRRTFERAANFRQNSIRLAAQAAHCRSLESTILASIADFSRTDSTDRIINSNLLKLTASSTVVDTCIGSLRIVGFPGYLNGSPSSVGRLIRDSLSAPLMIPNDYIATHTAAMLMLAEEC